MEEFILSQKEIDVVYACLVHPHRPFPSGTNAHRTWTLLVREFRAQCSEPDTKLYKKLMRTVGQGG